MARCESESDFSGYEIECFHSESTLTIMWSDELIGAEEEQQIFSGKLVKIRSRRDGVPLLQIRVGKLTDCVSPNESQKSFAEVPWQVRVVPTPSQLA